MRTFECKTAQACFRYEIILEQTMHVWLGGGFDHHLIVFAEAIVRHRYIRPVLNVYPEAFQKIDCVVCDLNGDGCQYDGFLLDFVDAAYIGWNTK